MQSDQEALGSPTAELLLPSEVSASLRVPEATLARWRAVGNVALPFVKVGGAVRYQRGDLQRFIASNTVQPVKA